MRDCTTLLKGVPKKRAPMSGRLIMRAGMGPSTGSRTEKMPIWMAEKRIDSSAIATARDRKNLMSKSR